MMDGVLPVRAGQRFMSGRDVTSDWSGAAKEASSHDNNNNSNNNDNNKTTIIIIIINAFLMRNIPM